METREFSVTLTRQADYKFDVQFDDPQLGSLQMDEPPPLGAGAGPNAARILGAAVGNCLSASLLFCLEKSHLRVQGMQTRVTGTIDRNERGRLRITGLNVVLDPDIAPEDRARMGRCLDLFEDYCIVTQSVRSGLNVDVEVTQPAGSV